MKPVRLKCRGTRLAVALLVLVAAVASCARKPLREPLKVRIAVLDMQVPKEFKSPKEVQGWWFSARDVYHDPNAGQIFSDLLAKRLRKLPYLEVHSRVDYKYYVARKLERLKQAFPNLTNDEIASLFNESSPVDIGKDMNHYWGVDKVVAGRILSGSTEHNRTFHWWKSSIEIEVSLIDVETGKTEWQATIEKSKNFRSQYRTMELAADELVRRMVKEYFLKSD
jgi:hypothetical protein